MLTKRISTPVGSRYYPVVLSNNGRLKPDRVVVNGEEEKHPDGCLLSGMAHGRQAHTEVCREGSHGRLSLQLRKERELNAIVSGIEIVPEGADAKWTALDAAIADYIEETRLSKKPKTCRERSALFIAAL